MRPWRIASPWQLVTERLKVYETNSKKRTWALRNSDGQNVEPEGGILFQKKRELYAAKYACRSVSHWAQHLISCLDMDVSRRRGFQIILTVKKNKNEIL